MLFKAFSKLFWISSILFTLHQLIELRWSIPFIHAYLDDFLAPSIVLGLALSFFQNIFPADPNFKLSTLMVFGFVLWYALLFEWVFPSYDERHFADLWDVLAYFLGGLLFLKWGNEPLPKKMR
jgi:hypothetical protein